METPGSEDFPMMLTGEENTDGIEDEFLDYYTSLYGVDFPERDTARVLYIYCCPALLGIGTIGNIISAVVLYKLCQKVLSTCLYLFVMTFLDIIVLFIKAGNDWVIHLVNHNLERIAMFSSNSVCKILPFASNFALHLGIWLIVAMATETTMVTLRKDKLLRACIIERARAVVLLIIVLLVCINAHCFWTFALQEDEKSGVPEEIICSNARQGHVNETFRRIVWPIIDMVVSNVIPIFSVFACTVIIITRRARGKNFTREEQNIWKSYKWDAVGAKDFQTTILVLSLFYLVLMLPKFACDIFLFLVDPNALALVKYSLKLDAQTSLGTAICSILHYSSLSLKFFVYLTSKRFREELKNILTCRSCRKSQEDPNQNPLTGKRVNNRCPLADKYAPSMNHDNPLEKKPFAITSV